MHRSDTLFLATGFSGLSDGADGVNGCDCNHRGGAPGFVEVLNPFQHPQCLLYPACPPHEHAMNAPSMVKSLKVCIAADAHCLIAHVM